MTWIFSIVSVLVLLLVIIRLSPLRARLERFDRERPEREARSAVEIRLRPLTLVLTMLFVCVTSLGLIYIFAFSDTAEDRWQHFYVVLPVAAFVGTCLAFAKKREDQRPLSLRTRRFIWGVVLAAYAAAFMIILALGLSPFSRFSDVLRLSCYLGTLAPLAFIAWSQVQSSEREAHKPVQHNAGSRPPSDEERAAALAHLQNHSDRREAVQDLVWGLVNSAEFLLRH